MQTLRERSGELTREAEAGHLSLVTKRGQPLFVTVPVSEELLDKGTRVSLAEHLSRLGIAIVDYPADELEEELRVANL